MKKILKSFADFLNEHWIWKSIILFLPSIYLPIIVKYFGEKIHLVKKDDSSLTKMGLIITVIIYLAVLFINILSSYKSKRDKEADELREKTYEKEIQMYNEQILSYENTFAVYVRLMNVIGNVCDNKLSSVYKYITLSLGRGDFQKPFNKTVYPEGQLKSIAREIKGCLSEMTHIPLNSISVSMAYEFPGFSKTPKWIDKSEVSQCLPMNDLLKKKTAFKKIYNGDTDFIFENDKKIAAKQGYYEFDKKDNRNGKIGSIICDDISVEDDNRKIARIILSIATYKYKFTDSEDEEVLRNISEMIEQVILQQFEKRIRLELALLFVKEQYNNK